MRDALLPVLFGLLGAVSFSAVAEAAGQEAVAPGEAPQPLLSDEALSLLRVSLERPEALEGAERHGAQAIAEVIRSLYRAYSTFEAAQSNQAMAASRTAPWTDRARSAYERGSISTAQTGQVIAMLRAYLEQPVADPPARRARSLLCHLRMFSDETSTYGEPLLDLGSPDLTPPEKIFSPSGSFTDAARRARVRGVVVIQIIVDREGCVAGMQALKGLPYGLTESAMEAMRWWSHEPARREGQPVAVFYNNTELFRIYR